MAWPGLLFDWETYAFYMLQLWFYQIAVKHTNHAPSFVPSLTLCTVPCGAEARRVCMFAHGGSVISQTGSCPCWRKTRGLVKKQCVTVPSTSQKQIGFECRTSLCDYYSKIKHEQCCPSPVSNKDIQFLLWPPLTSISGWSAARTVKTLIVTCTVRPNKRGQERHSWSDLPLAQFSIGLISIQCQSHVHIASYFTGMLLSLRSCNRNFQDCMVHL